MVQRTPKECFKGPTTRVMTPPPLLAFDRTIKMIKTYWKREEDNKKSFFLKRSNEILTHPPYDSFILFKIVPAIFFYLIIGDKKNFHQIELYLVRK